ncbi:hypothetical protein OF83DRAFT_1072882 [Amylostereum chailletii]|nr:hypothetical protein OF83DRAFT_1072882 [Amylostereum chailletii]
MTQPLPPNDFTLAHYRAAYTKCLELEAAFENDQKPTISGGLSPRICAGVLGYMLREAPRDSGRDNVARDINLCGDDQAALLALGQHYSDALLHFKAAKGRTPTPSQHPSPPSSDEQTATSGDLSEEAPSHASAKTKALLRDSNKCLVTGATDVSVFEKDRDFEAWARQQKLRAANTHCAHIILFSSTPMSKASARKTSRYAEHASSIWGVLGMFGEEFLDDLNGANTVPFKSVRQSRLWLEPTGTPNSYRVRGHRAYVTDGLPDQVTFSSPDPTELPLPDKKYLALHAACCRIAHLSGAAEAIDKILHDIEMTSVFAEDGSSADALAYALKKGGLPKAARSMFTAYSSI